jgi:hypothetical protein
MASATTPSTLAAKPAYEGSSLGIQFSFFRYKYERRALELFSTLDALFGTTFVTWRSGQPGGCPDEDRFAYFIAPASCKSFFAEASQSFAPTLSNPFWKSAHVWSFSGFCPNANWTIFSL